MSNEAFKNANTTMDIACRKDEFTYHSNYFIGYAIIMAFPMVNVDSRAFIELRSSCLLFHRQFKHRMIKGMIKFAITMIKDDSAGLMRSKTVKLLLPTFLVCFSGGAPGKPRREIICNHCKKPGHKQVKCDDYHLSGLIRRYGAVAG